MTPEYDPVRTEDSEDDARSLSCDVDDECMGTEMRAFNNIAWHRRTAENKIGLTGFGPNINLVRDPRFGRARTTSLLFFRR